MSVLTGLTLILSIITTEYTRRVVVPLLIPFIAAVSNRSNNIRYSGAKLWNAIKEDLQSAGRFRFKKLLKESVISKCWLVYFICS